MKKEIWKDIRGYKGLYQVSNCGRIKSFKVNRNAPKILKPFKSPCPTKSNPENYRLCVGLNKGDMKKDVKVHRLVAQAFFPDFKNKMYVKKKEKDADNNLKNNLAIAEFMGIGVIRCHPRSGKKIRKFLNITQASRATGLSGSSIGLCAHGLWKKAGGFRWKRADGNG